MFDEATASILDNNEYVGKFRKLIASAQTDLDECKRLQGLLNRKAKAERDMEAISKINENARDKIEKERLIEAAKEIANIDATLQSSQLETQLIEMQKRLNALKKDVQGEYTRLRDEVESIPTNKLPANQYQTIMRELQNLKYDAESLITKCFMVNNELANMHYGVTNKIEAKNEHCIKDKEYEMRKTLTERIYKPISKYMYSAISHPGETEEDVKRRRKKAHQAVIFVTEKMQESVSSLYTAYVEEDAIKRNLVEENCYNLLKPEESKWVFREVDMMRKKDSVNVYMQAGTQDFIDLTKVVCMMLYAYDFQETDDITTYMERVNAYVDSLGIRLMQMMFVFPELCLFAFPIEEVAAWIHSVNISSIEHAIEYNDNWDLEAAYMYWFWTHVQGEGYADCVDPDGNYHKVPVDAIMPANNYLNEVFKKKIKRVIRSTALKLTNKKLYADVEQLKVLSPWNHIIDGDKELPTYLGRLNGDSYSSGRSLVIHDNYINEAAKFIKKAGKLDDTAFGEFVSWFHIRVISTVPKYVWKSLNSLGGFKKLTSVSIQFIPNNYTLFDIDYEFWTAVLVVLNTIYWTHGYLNMGLPQKITDSAKAAIAAVGGTYATDIYKGGLCYDMYDELIHITTDSYEPFVVKLNPNQATIPGKVNMDTASTNGPHKPIRDYSYFGYNVSSDSTNVKYNYYYVWKSAGMSFITMNMDTLFPIKDADLVSFAGADCRMFPWNGYIKVNAELYKKSDTNCYNVARNKWLFTFSDFIMDKFAKSDDMLVNILYRATIPKLVCFRITLPYNIIIDSNYINYAHIVKHDDIKDPEKIARYPFNWEEKIAFPQHILSSSGCRVFDSHFNEVPAVKVGYGEDFTSMDFASTISNLEISTCKVAST